MYLNDDEERTFSSIGIVVNKSGNIELGNTTLKNNTAIYTCAGNIDIKFRMKILK